MRQIENQERKCNEKDEQHQRGKKAEELSVFDIVKDNEMLQQKIICMQQEILKGKEKVIVLEVEILIER